MSKSGAAESNSSENNQSNRNEKAKSSFVRLVGFTVALVLAVAAYILIPPESLDKSGQVIAGLSHTGRVVVAIAVLIAILWVTEALSCLWAAL